MKKRNSKKITDEEFIQSQIIECVKDIINNIQINTDAEYNDSTYKELYLKCTYFAKEISDILSSEIIKPDSAFDFMPDVFSFRNNKLT